MSNIPPGDAGVKLVPFAATFCEWLVTFGGKIATCVEVSEMLVAHNATAGRIPVSADEDRALTQDLINRGEASADGATNYVAAAAQLTRLGIPNDVYGPDWMLHNDFAPVARAAIDRGQAVLFGLYAAHALHDDWTNAAEDAGVNGHGIALVGYDASGFIVADPNTVQSKSGAFVHYSAANLNAAGGTYPSMVIPRGALTVATVQPVWDAAAGTLTYPAHDGLPQIVLDHGQAFWANSNRQGVYPLQAAGYDGAGNSVVRWSDCQKSVAVKTANWAVSLEPAGADLAAALADAAQVPTLSQQVAALKAQLASLQTTDAAEAAAFRALKAALAVA